MVRSTSGRLLVIGIVTLCTLGGSMAYAEQSPETVKCAKAITTSSAKFTKFVYKNVRKCILGIQKCAGDMACNEKLLEITIEGKAKGKCAAGKLDEGVEYWGEDSSELAALETNISKIGKAHFKFVGTLASKCMVPGVVFEGPDGIPGFDFTPADQFELGDYLNPNLSSGVACSGHVQIVAEFPNYETVIEMLFNAPNLINASVALGNIYNENSICK